MIPPQSCPDSSSAPKPARVLFDFDLYHVRINPQYCDAHTVRRHPNISSRLTPVRAAQQAMTGCLLLPEAFQLLSYFAAEHSPVSSETWHVGSTINPVQVALSLRNASSSAGGPLSRGAGTVQYRTIQSTQGHRRRPLRRLVVQLNSRFVRPLNPTSCHDHTQVPCTVNTDGGLDLPYCLGWAQNSDTNGCTGPGDVQPGTKSKCRCSAEALVSIPICTVSLDKRREDKTTLAAIGRIDRSIDRLISHARAHPHHADGPPVFGDTLLALAPPKTVPVF